MKTLFFLLPAFLARFIFNPTTAVVIGIIGFAYVVMTAPQKQKRNLIPHTGIVYLPGRTHRIQTQNRDPYTVLTGLCLRYRREEVY